MVNRAKAKGRLEYRSFVAVPHALLEAESFATLSAHGAKLIMDLYGQYRGNNNGDFEMSWSRMKLRGWKSKATLYRAKDELVRRGLIIQTRQGGKHRCSLYGVTWLGIDHCDGKLDFPSSVAPLGWWRHGRDPEKKIRAPYLGHIGTPSGPIEQLRSAN